MDEIKEKSISFDNCIILPTTLFIIFPICSMLDLAPKSCTKCFSTSWTVQSYHKLCIVVKLWEIICVIKYEIINFINTMLHFVLFYNVTRYTDSLLSRIHVNTTKLWNIMCTLVATCVIARSLECKFIYPPINQSR
jgi:hypothetical protein